MKIAKLWQKRSLKSNKRFYLVIRLVRRQNLLATINFSQAYDCVGVCVVIYVDVLLYMCVCVCVCSACCVLSLCLVLDQERIKKIIFVFVKFNSSRHTFLISDLIT